MTFNFTYEKRVLMKNFNLEICVDSTDSAIQAAHAGATRLELCSHLIIGGTTPTTSLLEMVKEHVNIPVHTLIRTRFGDFVYTDFEFEQMARDVVSCKRHLADGIVIGALTPDGKLHKEQLQTLINLGSGLHLTLSRCFDLCADPFEALETAIELGFHTILTSGLAASAPEGKDLLKTLIEKADGRIDIMPGAGVKSESLHDLATLTNAHSFHMSAKKLRPSLASYTNPSVYMGLPGIDESTIFEVSYEEIKNALDILSTL